MKSFIMKNSQPTVYHSNWEIAQGKLVKRQLQQFKMSTMQEKEMCNIFNLPTNMTCAW